MLVRFTVENYLSFRERVELSMVASKKVRRHPEHVVKPSSSSGIPLLKLAVLYGANASGKSNLITAMSMAKTWFFFRPKWAVQSHTFRSNLTPVAERTGSV